MKASLSFQANNTYKVELIDSRTGTVRKEGSFHNIVTKAINRMLLYTSGTATDYENRWLNYMFYMLRCGNGSTVPAVTDTNLAVPIWEHFSGTRSDIEWPSPNVMRCSCTYTIPASASYVGTVTEVGLFGKNNLRGSSSSVTLGDMCTRALLTDSEGQVISFNKTDLDILKITVTVEVSIVSSSDNFVLFNNPLPLSYLVIDRGKGTFWPYGGLDVRRYKADIVDYTPVAHYDKVAVEQGFDVSYKCTNTDARRGIDWSKVRIGSDTVTSETYYQGLAISGLGGWLLPNEAVFPAYSIKDIPIGTGDGSTTAFTSPLSYFKKDTDKVYKNGVLLTRGVDYTLSHCNNAKHLCEIDDIRGVLPKIVSYAGEPGKFGPGVGYPFLIGSRQPGSSAQQTTLGRVYSFNNSAPILFNYDEPVTLNYLKGNNVRTHKASNDVVPSGATYTLYYSDDGEQYTEAARATGSTFDVSFADITAKYWKLTTTTGKGYYGNWDGDYLDSNSFLTVGYSDPYITFAEAPAEGDSLTMEVEMDIIMKNSNFVIDAEASIDFTIGG